VHEHTKTSTPSMPEQLLHAHDEQVRGSISRRLPAGWTAYPDEHVLRVRTAHRGFAFSDGLHRLDSGHVEHAVEATLAFFTEHGEDFEWKTYSHDHPALVPALQRHGLQPEATETVLIGRTTAFTTAGDPPAGIRLQRVQDTADLERIATLQTEVWDEDWSWLADDLGGRIESGPENIAIWIAEAGGQAVSTAWLVTLPGTEFAGLWGGSTLEAWRHRGIYRSLVAARARAAEQLGIRYLWVDASEDSGPILQRLGMTAVATTTPWITHTSGQA
jgi:hypothetical protein